MGTRRRFWVGFVAGAFVMAVAFAGLVGMRKYERKKAAERSLVTPAEELPPLQFPDMTKLPNYGSVDRKWMFEGLDGRRAELSDFRGKVVFLNFWATWCGDCAQELGSIHSLETKLRGAPVEFVLVSDEDPAKIAGFVARLPFSISPYVTSEKPPPAFATFELPTTFIVAPDGTIVYRHLGVARWNQETCVKFLRALAAESAKG